MLNICIPSLAKLSIESNLHALRAYSLSSVCSCNFLQKDLGEHMGLRAVNDGKRSSTISPTGNTVYNSWIESVAWN